LLVDNGSRERGTRSLLKKLASAGARVLPQPGPFNFARINNAAVQKARGELVLLLNNDVEVDPGMVRALVEASPALVENVLDAREACRTARDALARARGLEHFRSRAQSFDLMIMLRM
jgi:hypothetical protein